MSFIIIAYVVRSYVSHSFAYLLREFKQLSWCEVGTFVIGGRSWTIISGFGQECQ